MTRRDAEMELFFLALTDKLDEEEREAVIRGKKALEEPEIVRCKDCIYLRRSDPFHPDTEWCQRLICGTVNPEFFCADGRRKEKGDD